MVVIMHLLLIRLSKVVEVRAYHLAFPIFHQHNSILEAQSYLNCT